VGVWFRRSGPIFLYEFGHVTPENLGGDETRVAHRVVSTFLRPASRTPQGLAESILLI